MYAHVITHRLSTTDELDRDITQHLAGEVISDQGARTIASYWHSPGEASRNITALSHGLPFDTEELRSEITRERDVETNGRGDIVELDALLAWLDALEDHLSD